MGKTLKKLADPLGLFKGPKKIKPTTEELNLEREQLTELRDQESEKARRRSLLGRGGRRSLIATSERGV